jgi:hypothetical protein
MLKRSKEHSINARGANRIDTLDLFGAPTGGPLDIVRAQYLRGGWQQLEIQAGLANSETHSSSIFLIQTVLLPRLLHTLPSAISEE